MLGADTAITAAVLVPIALLAGLCLYDLYLKATGRSW